MRTSVAQRRWRGKPWTPRSGDAGSHCRICAEDSRLSGALARINGKMAKMRQRGAADATIKKLSINPYELKKQPPAEQIRTPGAQCISTAQEPRPPR